MEIQLAHATTGSPSYSSSSSSSAPNPNTDPNPDQMQSWWESISKARARIQSLSSIFPSASIISSLADSDRPARSLLESPDAFLIVSAHLSGHLSGSGNDPLCQWLYETFQSTDSDLQVVVLSFLPLLSGIYLSRVVSSNPPSLAGFEAVLLSIYASETKSRAGKPLLVSVPDLSQPSLYHTPRLQKTQSSNLQAATSIGVLSAPLEPQVAVKSTKRACIVGVALDCYYKKISLMPSFSKLDLCEFATAWAGQDCSCANELDGDNDGYSSVEIRVMEVDGDEIDSAEDEMGRLMIGEKKCLAGENGHCNVETTDVSRGARIPLPWDIFQPVLRILGHCLLAPLNPNEVRDAAAVAVRHLYARALHDLLPQAILATRSLIQLDKRARMAAKAAAVAANAESNANTPTKPRKPEILLVSK